MADSYAAEITAGAGYDWLVIDGEPSPNDLRSTLPALQAMAAKPVNPNPATYRHPRGTQLYRRGIRHQPAIPERAVLRPRLGKIPAARLIA